MSSSRNAVIAAVRGSKNLDAAAKSLGISRRTLQNRMRAYGLARSKGGRPRRKLAYKRRRAPGWGMVMAAAAAGALTVGVLKGGGGTSA